MLYAENFPGVDPTGATDSAAGMQSALTAAANNTLVISAGVYKISTQLTVTNPCTIILQGIIRPYKNAANSGTALLRIMSHHVAIHGEGRGTIDGISATYSNWNGIDASDNVTLLENVRVDGVRLCNIGIDNTTSAAIHFHSVKGGRIKDCDVVHCGVVGNTLGGGFGIYLVSVVIQRYPGTG
jgi:hypothetical protein